MSIHRLRLVFVATLLFSISVVYAQRITVPVVCGTFLEAELLDPSHNPIGSEADFYSIELNPGDSITIIADPLASAQNIYFRLFDPSGQLIADTGWGNDGGEADIIDDYQVGATGTYNIGVGGTAVGVYTLSIGCNLRDGTIIAPGDVVPVPVPTEDTSASPFISFGFLGADSVDFSAGIPLPLALGTPQTAPVGGDIVALYTIDAAAGQVSTLTLSRVSGELSIGVAVINSTTNDIIFFGGMPSSDNLSVELTFPEAGSYAIGLFALDTDTSGAVQITLE